MKKNLVSIDVARGLAALSVFVYHYGIGQVLAKHTGFSVFNWIAIPGAIFAVPLFFVISGFCVHGSEWRRLSERSEAFDLGGYAMRRFRRIYPLYIVALLVSCAFAANWPSGKDFWLHVFLLQGFSLESFNSINVVLWTISVELFFYIIYPAWLRLRLKIGLTYAYLIGTALSLTSCSLTAAFWYPYANPARWFFLNTWCGWLVGALLAETISRDSRFYSTWKWWIIGAGGCIIWLWVESLDEGRSQIMVIPMRIVIFAWPLSALVRLEGALTHARGGLKLLAQSLSTAGMFSYSLYLLHEPAISIRMDLESRVDLGSIKPVFDALYFFIVLGVCWLSYHFIERTFVKGPRQASELHPVPKTPS